MSKIYVPPSCEYEVAGMHIHVANPAPKKVSGTMMAGILGCSPWSSPFQVACNLLGLAREDISAKAAVKTGQILEPVIIEYVGARYPSIGTFVDAESIYQKREGDHDTWVSDFDDDVFAGHVDGIVMTEDGQDYILEVKTSANLESWVKGVPEYYMWQVGLYNEFITKKDKAYVVLGMVDADIHANPNLFVPNDKTILLIEADMDRKKIQEGLEQVRTWYRDLIMNGITPDYDPSIPGDVEMYNHLLNLTDDIDTIRNAVDRLGEVEDRISESESKHKIDYELRDILKNKIKTYLDCHTLSSLDSASEGYKVSVRTSVRTKIDPVLMEADGVDASKYTLTTTVKTFTIKKKTIGSEKK